MLRLALRGLVERRARTAFTLLAVLLGVGLMAGTMLLTDTISRSIDRLLAVTDQAIDVRVTAPEEEGDRGGPGGGGSSGALLPADLLDRAGRVDGVALASGALAGGAVTVVDDRGRRVGPSSGAPTILTSGGPRRFDPFDYDGRAPRSVGEAAIGRTAAKAAGLALGSTIRVQGTGRVRRLRIVGLASLAGSGSFGPGAGFVVATLADAQAIVGAPGRLSEIDIAADQDTAPTALRTRLERALGPGVRVRTASQATAERSADVDRFIGPLRAGLLVFALIALLVGGFVIFNTFSITVAQRTRELGLLRTLGASRRQVRRSVLLEAAMTGVLGSLLGFLAGLGLAPAMLAGVRLLGVELPPTGLQVEPRTFAVSVIVGCLVTAASGVLPALRATRVPPLAALLESMPPPTRRAGRVNATLQVVVLMAAVALLLVGLFAGLATTPALVMLGLGALLVFVGVGLLSPRLVRPLAWAVGLPLRAWGGVAGRIAVGNATRVPTRTAGTAAALMVGVALVCFVSIFVAGLKASFTGAFESSVRAQLVVAGRGGPVPLQAVDVVRGTPGVAAASGLLTTSASATARQGGAGRRAVGAPASGVRVTGVDPGAAARIIRWSWTDGSDPVLARLRDDGAVVNREWADDHGVTFGSRLRVTRGRGAAARGVDLTVRGVYEDRGGLLGDITASDRTVGDGLGGARADAILIATRRGSDPSTVRSAVDRALQAGTPGRQVQLAGDFIEEQVGQINAVLYLCYALLGLSVLIALFGIVNTLALSIHERTRELGLLRAVGASGRQMRRIVRGEAVITAVMGSVLGVVVGVLLAVLVSRPLADDGFVLAFPLPTLAAVLVLGALAGVGAAVIPARRASRLDVLAALAV